MTVTNVKIIKTENNSRQLADVEIVIDGCLLIQNIKLIDNGDRMFIAFPSSKRKNSHKESIDVIPLTQWVRGYIEDEVIKKYREVTERNDSQ